LFKIKLTNYTTFALEKTLKLYFVDLVLSKANQQNRIALNLTVLDTNTDL
jgi:hypothetical protein